MCSTDSSTSGSIDPERRDDIMAIIRAMRRQDEIYLPEDYLQSMEDQAEEEEEDNPFDAFTTTKPIDEHWRCKMVEWCYSVSDQFTLNRDTVAIAMNSFDRFVSIITAEICDDDDNKQLFGRHYDQGVIYYQLALMVCLYTAVKVHEPVAMEPKIISLLSKGLYSEQQVIEMERSIITTIQWRFNPPTPMSFVHLFLSIIPTDIIHPKTKDYTMILELTKQQIELGITDYLFVGSYASCMALAALTNAIHAITTYNSPLKLRLQTIISNIITSNDICMEDFVLYQDCLWNLVKKPNHKNQQRMNNSTQSIVLQKMEITSNNESILHSSPRGISSPPFHTQK